jgi:hypothetical protein
LAREEISDAAAVLVPKLKSVRMHCREHPLLISVKKAGVLLAFQSVFFSLNLS